MKAPGWKRLSPPGAKLDALWKHVSGWKVRHCGHPTANFPYYAIDPKHPGHTTMTHNGRGFRRLADAFDQITGVLSGSMRTTGEGCARGVRRIVEVS